MFEPCWGVSSSKNSPWNSVSSSSWNSWKTEESLVRTFAWDCERIVLDGTVHFLTVEGLSWGLKYCEKNSGRKILKSNEHGIFHEEQLGQNALAASKRRSLVAYLVILFAK